MEWIITSLQWYFALLFLGLIFVPMTGKLFSKLFLDRGYAFSKILSLLFLSYTTYFLGTLKLFKFSQVNLIVFTLIFLVGNILIYQRGKEKKDDEKTRSIVFSIISELLFLSSFFFWIIIRGQEPSIRGLEKFMDFGFMNSILRSDYFPPLDMWLSADPTKTNGYFINYYYFGHLTGSLLMKLTGIKSSLGYNLLLATIFALGVTQTFSLVGAIIYNLSKNITDSVKKNLMTKVIFFGLLGAFIVNLGGNLHTIYTFTTGYPNESPIPFWKILSSYNPGKYWYPNATRFIPFTIHEFPSYSWVVADLHGHVFDIPFVLLTLAFLFIFFIKMKDSNEHNYGQNQKFNSNYQNDKSKIKYSQIPISIYFHKFQFISVVFLGFLTAVHYMTNAFDGPIYLLLSSIILFLLFRFSWNFIFYLLVLILSFVFFSLPFSLHFQPFVSGIGVNCSPQALINFKKIGPFIFEKGNCQTSPFWMMFLLWGFFWINFILFLGIKFFDRFSRYKLPSPKLHLSASIDHFIFVLFAFGTFLVVIPEFFYIKDIYPAHFRANTMFKLGYQAFMMMGIASAVTFFYIKLQTRIKAIIFGVLFVFFFFFVGLYPFFSIPSYYGNLKKPVVLDGSLWIESTFPEDKDLIDYINDRIVGQPTILEAQGDSYTDFERISAYTGVPTIAGWWVHEWLWRGSADVVGSRIPEIATIYESDDMELTRNLLKKYKVSYVVVSNLEREKYKKLNEKKFNSLGRLIFRSKNKFGALYQVNP